MSSEFLIDIFKGFYPYFSLFALVVIVYRIKRKLWTIAESILLGLVVLHAIMLIGQIVFADHKLEISRRYLLSAAPLLFGWSAWGLCQIYQKIRPAKLKAIVNYVLIPLSIILVIDGLNGVIKYYTSAKKSQERQVVQIASRWIVEHYHDIAIDQPLRHGDLYRSPFRPVVWSSYPSLGYFARGRSEPSAFCENAIDYYVLPLQDKVPEQTKILFRFIVNNQEYVIYGN